MARIIPGGGLFNTDEGRVATCRNVHCDWCGTTYTDREDETGEGYGDSIEIAQFGHLQVLECCFEKVEAAVLANIGDIIPWFLKILDGQQRYIDRHRQTLTKLAAIAGKSA